MIIDSHTHIFPPDLIRNREAYLARAPYFARLYQDPRARMATAEDLVETMDGDGVDRAVICGFAFRDQDLCDACNDYVLDACHRYDDRLIPFVVLSPGAGRRALHSLARAIDAGAVGIGELMPDGQGFALSEKGVLDPLLGIAREANRPVMMHVNERVGHPYAGKGSQGPEEAYRLALGHPDNTFIFSHWGGGLLFYELMPEVRSALARVYYDTAASPFLYDDAIFAHAASLAPDRVLFGSDYPLIRPRRYLRRIERLELGDEITHKFLGLNATGLFGSAPQTRPEENLL